MTPRLSLRPTAQGRLVECVDDRHGASPPVPVPPEPTVTAPPQHARIAPSRPAASGAVRCKPISVRPKGTAFRMRAGGAGSVGPILGRRKRTATPMSARSAAEYDRVDDALDRSPSATQSSTPLTRRRRRRRPSVPGDAPSLPTRVHPYQGRHSSPCPGPRHRPHNTGTCRPRAPTPGTGVAPPPPQRGRPWRLCRPKHASPRTVPPPPGRGAGHESAPAPEGRLVATRAGGAGSVGPISGRGKRTATPMTASYDCGSDRGGAAGDHAPSSPSVLRLPTARSRHRRSLPVSCDRPNIFFLSLWRCAILVASYLARSLSQLSSAICQSTPRGAGCPPRNLTGRHHRDGLPRAKPHPQFRRRRGKTPMVTTPPRILVSIRLTLLRLLPHREFLGERSNAEHRRLPGRQAGTVT